MSCRRMGMKIMPPDINEGEGGFSCFRTARSAMVYRRSRVSVSRWWMRLLRERTEHGKFRSLEDFIDRMSGRGGQQTHIGKLYQIRCDGRAAGNPQAEMYGLRFDGRSRRIKRRKIRWKGRCHSLILQRKRDKKSFQITFRMSGSIRGKNILAYEKEMLGVYVSGHPLEEYIGTWEKNVTAKSSDFVVDEETGSAVIHDARM